MSSKKQVVTIVLLIVAVVSLSGWLSNVVGTRSPDYYNDLRKNLTLFSNVFDAIALRYVEEVDPDKLIQAAINGMIDRLDPYTVYLEADDDDEIQIMAAGKYGGVGMRIGMRNDWATVVEQPFDGKPAFRAGIREGDQIIEVDGENTKDFTISETAQRLRGKPGTEVAVKIRRQGASEPLEFRLIRDTITVKDVNCATTIEDDIGYIRLTRFGRNAGDEVERAIESLREAGAKSLILDLRSNPGGLLETAVEVADNFIKKGELIVYTKGRSQDADNKYRARKEAALGDLPLVVLVDRFSASASEIVAGAVQDLDRGVVVGKTTFGKGLVQKIVGVGPKSTLKVTFAEYYIPSGRLIQRPDVFMRGTRSVFPELERSKETEDSDEAKKEETTEYFTAAGRKVFGGGGVVPDVEVDLDTLNRFEFALLSKSMFFNFALHYAQQHPDLPRRFVVDDGMLNEFKEYLEESDFQFKGEGENELDGFVKAAKKRGYAKAIAEHLDAIRNTLEEDKDAEYQESLEYIRWSLEREITTKLYGTAAGIESVLDDDEVVQKAVEILSDSDRYWTILGKKVDLGG